MDEEDAKTPSPVNEALPAAESVVSPLTLGAGLGNIVHTLPNREAHPHEDDPDWEEWCKVHANLKKARLDRAGDTIVPQTFEQYKEHKRQYTELKELTFKNVLDARVNEAIVYRELGIPRFSIYDMPCERDGRSTVLGKPTIWTALHLDPHPVRDEAPWPSHEELVEDGDERHTSHFSRFLPCPRISGNDTVNWKQTNFMRPEVLDRVSPVPVGKRDYPGLTFDEVGKPYDDFGDTGLTAYVEKNPFDPLAQLEYELQKHDFDKQNEIVREFNSGNFQRSVTPVHPLSWAGRGGKISSAALAAEFHHVPQRGPRRARKMPENSRANPRANPRANHPEVFGGPLPASKAAAKPAYNVMVEDFVPQSASLGERQDPVGDSNPVHSDSLNQKHGTHRADEHQADVAELPEVSKKALLLSSDTVPSASTARL